MTDRLAPTVLIKAHAKVNLFLAVGGRREDGYHDVTTVIQALELHDDVAVTLGGEALTLDCEPDVGVAPEHNLAHRAAQYWFESSDVTAGAHIQLRKRIPAGAGLGGGSADAAAVLKALALLDGIEESAGARMAGAAARLGADVPFFLGGGTQLLMGRGDELVETLPTPLLDVVLVNPGIPVETGAAYARFDRTLQPAPPSHEAMVTAIRGGAREAIAAALYDNMTEPSVALVPDIGLTLRFLERSAGVLGFAMAGSGSTVFGVCADPASAESCAAEARERGWWACATRTVSAGLDVVDPTMRAR
ncbi:MAG: 4-(cytidine 5'-diphospho)-2-C-methyl-D-erythritol kinase [Coriobacteriia bacterium]|nr:4-(cytidine 5'-diphospho)-2-C-methyl-D-erythritol kinase [Coriobacteriia bacterium]